VNNTSRDPKTPYDSLFLVEQLIELLSDILAENSMHRLGGNQTLFARQLGLVYRKTKAGRICWQLKFMWLRHDSCSTQSFVLVSGEQSADD
jgi:hypothetical protein